jgi:glycosyltransferase involved in cell wall biosynthesis
LFKNNNFFGKKIINYLKQNITNIIAIDNDVKKSLTKKLNVSVIRNILNKVPKKYFKKKENNKYINIGYLGSFLKYKGIEDLIYVLEKLVIQKYNIRLYLAGNFIKNNFLFNLFNLSNNINKNLLKSKNIIFLGHLNELEKFYSKIDIMCFPSYLNALGRQVIEAGFYKIPSIVCLKKNYSDSFVNKRTGLSLKKGGDTKNLEKIIQYFYFNRKQIVRMGKNAQKLVSKNFNVKKNFKKLDKIYINCLNKL